MTIDMSETSNGPTVLRTRNHALNVRVKHSILSRLRCSAHRLVLTFPRSIVVCAPGTSKYLTAEYGDWIATSQGRAIAFLCSSGLIPLIGLHDEHYISTRLPESRSGQELIPTFFYGLIIFSLHRAVAKFRIVASGEISERHLVEGILSRLTAHRGPVRWPR
jgi:hypothetical protein